MQPMRDYGLIGSGKINGATHKHVYYRIIRGEDAVLQEQLSRLGNLINEFGGRTYGTQVFQIESSWISKVMISFEIPTNRMAEFEKRELE